MHRKVTQLVSAALAILSLASCRSLVMEDRRGCPRYISFDLANAADLDGGGKVFATLFRSPELTLEDTGETTAEALVPFPEGFRLQVRLADEVCGYGIMGFTEKSIRDGDRNWIVPLGKDADPWFRFGYDTPTEDDHVTVPVKMTKEHARVKIKFRGMEEFVEKSDLFPFNLVVSGNICGFDALTGSPVEGNFEFCPAEKEYGHFSFILPRQKDGPLSIGLYGRPGVYDNPGLVQTYNLWWRLSEEGVTWEEENLPDITIIIDYKKTQMYVDVDPWTYEDIIYSH